MIKDENFKAKDPKEEASCQYTLKKTAKKAAKKPLAMKQAAKKTQKKADMPRSLQLKNSSQEASSQEDPKEGSQETSSLFARFLHAFWTLFSDPGELILCKRLKDSCTLFHQVEIYLEKI